MKKPTEIKSEGSALAILFYTLGFIALIIGFLGFRNGSASNTLLGITMVAAGISIFWFACVLSKLQGILYRLDILVRKDIQNTENTENIKDKEENSES